jgi:hypothetical protein
MISDGLYARARDGTFAEIELAIRRMELCHMKLLIALAAIAFVAAWIWIDPDMPSLVDGL